MSNFIPYIADFSGSLVTSQALHQFIGKFRLNNLKTRISYILFRAHGVTWVFNLCLSVAEPSFYFSSGFNF